MAKEMAEQVRKERAKLKQEEGEEKEREAAGVVKSLKHSGQYPGYGGGWFKRFLKSRGLVRPTRAQVKKRRHNQQVQQAENKKRFNEGVKALQNAQKKAHTLKKQGVASRHLTEDPRSRGHSNVSNAHAEDPHTRINENAANKNAKIDAHAEKVPEYVKSTLRDAFKGRFPVAKNAKEVYERSAAPARAAAAAAAAADAAATASRSKRNKNAAARRATFSKAANNRANKLHANEVRNAAISKAKIAAARKEVAKLEKTSGASKKARWGVSIFSGTRKSPFTKGPSSGSKRVLVNNPLASKRG